MSSSSKARRANPALVNNLDLTVVTPGGETYKGNVYSGGQSTTGGSADFRNVEECVRCTSPAVGDWTIRVRGINVPQGGRQPFALVTTGSFADWPEPPASAEEIDRTRRLILDPARPNPFSETTTLSFLLPRASRARLTIHDSRGRLVATLVDTRLPAGPHLYNWDGRLPGGAVAGSGIYFYLLETDRGKITRKMSLLR
jgi:hypothetical protein